MQRFMAGSFSADKKPMNELRISATYLEKDPAGYGYLCCFKQGGLRACAFPCGYFHNN